MNVSVSPIDRYESLSKQCNKVSTIDIKDTEGFQKPKRQIKHIEELLNTVKMNLNENLNTITISGILYDVERKLNDLTELIC